MADWNQLVVGGIDKPRILLLDENFCENPLFTKNLDGWTVSGATIERLEDASAYIQYMCEVTFGGLTNYVEYVYDLGNSISNRKFMVALNVVSASDYTLVFAGDIEFGSTVITGPKQGKSFIVGTATGVTGTTVSFRIYGNGSLKFDNIYFSEVFEDIEMPQPHDSGKLMFDKELAGNGKLWTGKSKEYNAKWVPSYKSEYFYLAENYEIYRQKISEAENLFVIPHMDYDYGFLGKWNEKEFERSYSFQQYDGHAGILSIKGIEFVNQQFAIDLVIYYEVLVTAFLPIE
jgi:hypothetical protein